jgi:hypothetical protein
LTGQAPEEFRKILRAASMVGQGGKIKSREQNTESRIQKDKAEARNQEPEETENRICQYGLSLIFWLLTPDF